MMQTIIAWIAVIGLLFFTMLFFIAGRALGKQNKGLEVILSWIFMAGCLGMAYFISWIGGI